MTIAGLVQKGRLERIPADRQSALVIGEEAERHLWSAEQITRGDPNGAYQLVYEGLRKALVAHMLSEGLRATNRPGAHAAVGEYGVTAGLLADIRRFDRIRKNRHRSAYELAFFDEDEIAVDLAFAREIVESVRGILK